MVLIVTDKLVREYATQEERLRLLKEHAEEMARREEFEKSNGEFESELKAREKRDVDQKAWFDKKDADDKSRKEQIADTIEQVLKYIEEAAAGGKNSVPLLCSHIEHANSSVVRTVLAEEMQKEMRSYGFSGCVVTGHPYTQNPITATSHFRFEKIAWDDAAIDACKPSTGTSILNFEFSNDYLFIFALFSKSMYLVSDLISLNPYLFVSVRPPRNLPRVHGKGISEGFDPVRPHHRRRKLRRDLAHSGQPLPRLSCQRHGFQRCLHELRRARQLFIPKLPSEIAKVPHAATETNQFFKNVQASLSKRKTTNSTSSEDNVTVRSSRNFDSVCHFDKTTKLILHRKHYERNEIKRLRSNKSIYYQHLTSKIVKMKSSRILKRY